MGDQVKTMSMTGTTMPMTAGSRRPQRHTLSLTAHVAAKRDREAELARLRAARGLS